MELGDGEGTRRGQNGIICKKYRTEISENNIYMNIDLLRNSKKQMINSKHKLVKVSNIYKGMHMYTYTYMYSLHYIHAHH